MVLLILYFVPFDLLTPQDSFNAVADKLFVSPVVRTLVFTKASKGEVHFAAAHVPCSSCNRCFLLFLLQQMFPFGAVAI